jgi:hypothetical protein
MKRLLTTLLFSALLSLGFGGTGTVIIPVQAAKLSGAYVTTAHTGVSAAVGAQIDGGESNWKLLFDAATDEAAVFGFRMPSNYASGGVLKIQYTMASATALEVDFEALVMAVTDADAADVVTSSFNTLATGTDTVVGTAGYLDEISITLTMDGAVAGDFIYIYLSTDSDDATLDDATGDREVVMLSFEYTT